MFVPNTTSRPPPGLAILQEEQLVVTLMTQVPFLITLYVGFRRLSKGDPTCLLFALGGVIASRMEPIVDVMGFCFFPREGSWVAFESHGRPIPIFVPGTYSWFVGGQGYWFLTILRDPKTRRQDIGRIWLRSFVANLFLEYPALYFGIYVYYGYQPLSIGGFPLWFPALHAFSPLLAAVLVQKLESELVGIKKMAIPFIVSASYIMANSGMGWPVWVALSLDTGYLASYIGATVTVFQLIIGLWIVSTTIPAERQKGD